MSNIESVEFGPEFYNLWFPLYNVFSIQRIWTMIKYYNNETFKNILYKKFIQKINEIEYMPQIIEEIKRINEIPGSKAIITGSTVMQILLNEKWDSDIDIFTNKNTEINFNFSKLRKVVNSDKKYKKYNNKLPIVNLTQYFAGSDLAGSDLAGSNCVASKVFEIVKMDTDSCDPNDIVHDFDLSGVKCWFDGTTLHINMPDYTFNKIMFLDNTLNKNTTNEKRIEKYINRGFEIRSQV